MSSFLNYSTAGQTANDPLPISSTRNPTTSDVIGPDGAPYNVGRTWVNTTTSAIFIYAGHGVWVSLSSSASGPVETITGDTGTATPVAGNIQIAGTANQITSTASGSSVTLSVPSAFIAPGSIAATTTVTGTSVTATTGAVTASLGNVVAGAQVLATTGLSTSLGNVSTGNGNVSLLTAGNKIIIATGANASTGTSAAMSGSPGAVTVATTASSTTALIFYSRKTTGGTPGQVSITAQDGTGFTLTSTGNETSTFNWWIINA
jgi:hypothetical protein